MRDPYAGRREQMPESRSLTSIVSPTYKNHTHLKQVGSGEEYPAGTQLYTCQFCQFCGKTRKGDPGFSIYRRYTHTLRSLTTPTNSKHTSHFDFWVCGDMRNSLEKGAANENRPVVAKSSVTFSNKPPTSFSRKIQQLM